MEKRAFWKQEWLLLLLIVIVFFASQPGHAMTSGGSNGQPASATTILQVTVLPTASNFQTLSSQKLKVIPGNTGGVKTYHHLKLNSASGSAKHTSYHELGDSKEHDLKTLTQHSLEKNGQPKTHAQQSVVEGEWILLEVSY